MQYSFPKADWRLLVTEPASGAWNMALDEAVLESVSSRTSLPTIRLFFWQPPCVSLGHAQTCKNLDLQTIEKHGWSIVRRPTGGKAILHTDEITYSVIAPADDPRVKGSVLESYRSIARVLLETLRNLGIQANADNVYSGDQTSRQKPVCFETPSNYEITVDGKKIIGSAQMRRFEVMLQHGAIPLSGDLTRINNAILWENDQKHAEADQRLLAHATTLENILGKEFSFNDVQTSLIASFERLWNISLLYQESASDEISRALILMKEKYENPEWTFRI